MGDFPESLFRAIPHIAGDLTALIGYVVACFAWVIVAIKVQRNKNLLKHLDKLPKNQRLEALRQEMGAIPIPDNITATEFLRARLHSYYFWASMTLLILLALLGALAIRYRPTPAITLAPKDLSSAVFSGLQQAQTKQEGEQDDKYIHDWETKIRYLDLGRSSSYYLQPSQFGAASGQIESGKSLGLFWIDARSLFRLFIEFTNDQSTGYTVTSLSDRFKPQVPFLGDPTILLGSKPLNFFGDSFVYFGGGGSGGNITVVRIGGDTSNAARFSYFTYVSTSEGDQEASYELSHAAENDTDLIDKTLDGDAPISAGGQGPNPFNSFSAYTTPHDRERYCNKEELNEATAKYKGDPSKYSFFSYTEDPEAEFEKCSFPLWYVRHFDVYQDAMNARKAMQSQ
ncbi:hypothetical protein [Tunturiibacter gelidoferens]|uniref:Uncharacterized protein n=1 Tax=Tunturiibacter gelidiferens TaxID=3069689 RepID=A0A9X0QCF9_9BACT|nr:hypothetical protein [Edaphobacter lichenicola]MBB5327806.1 hypothetical protein [Edaphobacter lichenicola]